MKKKFIIIGMENDGYRSQYVFKKNSNFNRVFINFLVDLGFVNVDFDASFENGKEGLLNISKFKDEENHFKNKSFDIDLFYGDKKAILIVRTKNRAKLIRILEKYSVFPKIKEPGKKRK